MQLLQKFTRLRHLVWRFDVDGTMQELVEIRCDSCASPAIASNFNKPLRLNFFRNERVTMPLFSQKRSFSFRRWLKSTSRRTFVVYPLCIVVIELLIRRGDLQFVIWGVPLLIWGYAQYRLSGVYRTSHGGGGPGIDIPPERVVDSGIYAYTRNPMYLGHLIFMLGLAITFCSIPAALLLVFHVFWFQRRVREDELHLTTMFGETYRDYLARVKRWIPGVI